MHRTIKSFILRGGRVTPRQQQGLDRWLKNYQIASEGRWHFETIFGREAKTVLEIGFGMGASLLQMARMNPETNYIGIEVHQAGIGGMASDLHEHALTNVRLVSQDAVEIVQTRIENDSLDGIQLFFPDPWPKKKHHKRRLVQADFIHLLAMKLKSGGFIHCATDWQSYAEQMIDVLLKEPTLVNQYSDDHYAPRPETRPLTRFEQRGKRLGHDVWDLIFIRE